MRIFRALAILAAVTGSTQAFARQQLSYEPVKAELSGIVVTQQFYGPPSFGEDPATDQKVQVLELKLDAPVDVIAPPPTGTHNDIFAPESAYHVTRIGLVDLDYPARHLDSYLGQRVTVSGKLYHQDNALQYVEVLIEVNRISRNTK